MKKKLLLITQELKHYRVPLLNKLNEEYELTVAHATKERINTNFNQKKIVFNKIGPFLKIKKMPELDGFDAIILTFNLRILSFYGLFQKKIKPKVFLWGIGVSASYKNEYDANRKLDWLRKWWINKSDGVIFYDNYPKIKYLSSGISPTKLYVAYNTIESYNNFSLSDKTYESFLFIGSLYKAKGFDVLLESYLEIYKKFNNQTPKLDIIGDGNKKTKIEKWIRKNNLVDKVILHGKITNDSKLSFFFNKAIVCISPGQAGLSVLKSFSFGVPFVTSENAITGGERFNIINNVNGFLYKKNYELVNILSGIIDSKTEIIKMSNAAYTYYHEFRNTDVWLDGFNDALSSINK